MITDFNGKPIIDFNNQIGEAIPIATYQHPDYSGSMLTAELREPAKQRLIEWLRARADTDYYLDSEGKPKPLQHGSLRAGTWEDFAEEIMSVIDLFVVETVERRSL